MKILLTTLNAKYIHSNLALKYLYTNLVDRGFPQEELTLQEFTINHPSDFIFGEIVGGGYDVICISCYIWNIDQTLAVCENVKKALPKARIILGGPEVSFDTDELLRSHPFIDAVAPGEMKSLPFPYKYLEPEQDKVIYYESMRGCPFQCAYCLSSISSAIETLPLERVYEELSFFLSRRVKQVKFIDRTFNFDSDRAVCIIRYILEHDNGVTNFHFEMCAELITEDLIQALSCARTGLFQLEIGIQSTNVLTLSACNRKGDFSKARKNIASLQKNNNIHIHLDLIAGLPLESYESFKRSFNDVFKLKPDHLQLGFLKLLKGSPIREASREHDYRFWAQAPYEVISNRHITAGELLILKRTENILNLFYNRGGFEKTLNFCIEELDEPPFHFFEALSGYFYRGGCQHRSWKKEELYRILYDFLTERDEYEPESLKKLLDGEYETGNLKGALAGKDVKKTIKQKLYRDMNDTLPEDTVRRMIKKYPFLEVDSD